MSVPALRTTPRPVAGHLVVATVAGGVGGAVVAGLGSLVAVVWPGGEGAADPRALVGLPAVFGLLGAVLGLGLGLVVGLATMHLRRSTTPKVMDEVAWALALVVALGGGIPLGWVWGEAMGAGALPWAGAMAFCFGVARPVARRGLLVLLRR